MKLARFLNQNCLCIFPCILPMKSHESYCCQTDSGLLLGWPMVPNITQEVKHNMRSSLIHICFSFYQSGWCDKDLFVDYVCVASYRCEHGECARSGICMRYVYILQVNFNHVFANQNCSLLHLINIWMNRLLMTPTVSPNTHWEMCDMSRFPVFAPRLSLKLFVHMLTGGGETKKEVAKARMRYT